jgi:hypothetical protein
MALGLMMLQDKCPTKSCFLKQKKLDLNYHKQNNYILSFIFQIKVCDAMNKNHCKYGQLRGSKIIV